MDPRTNPARVLFIDHTAIMGGGEIALLNVVKHIDKSKFMPIVLLFADGPLTEKMREIAEVHVIPLSKEIGETRKDSLGIGSLSKIGTILRTLRFAVQVSRFVAAHRIDIVHTNSLKADIIGGLAARLAFRPVVWHVRDRIDTDYLPRTVVGAFRVLARIIPSHVIANSTATMKTLSLRKDLSTAVPSGVDIERASVVHDGVAARKHPTCQASEIVRLGLIGRISPWKGQHIFIQAAAQVHADRPDARFYIIGSALFGEHDYEEQVRVMVERLGVSSVVEFTGFCSNVMERIEALDIVVHASTTGEPFGQVIIEGMSAAKPVIATNGGGVPEIVLDGKTGILVPMSDVSAMASAMRWMLNHPADSAEMGRRGRGRVLESFTVQKSTLRVEEIFSDILSRA